VAEKPMVAEQPEEVMERVEIEILSQPEISIRPAASSAQERRMEAQQPGSPSVLMPTSRVVVPSPTKGVLSGKAPIAEASLVQVSSSSSKEHNYYSGDEVDFGDEPVFLTPACFRIFQRRRCRRMFLQWFHHQEKSPPPREFLLSLLFIFPLS